MSTSLESDSCQKNSMGLGAEVDQLWVGFIEVYGSDGLTA
jgi:hypothetical protein